MLPFIKFWINNIWRLQLTKLLEVRIVFKSEKSLKIDDSIDTTRLI